MAKPTLGIEELRRVATDPSTPAHLQTSEADFDEAVEALKKAAANPQHRRGPDESEDELARLRAENERMRTFIEAHAWQPDGFCAYDGCDATRATGEHYPSCEIVRMLGRKPKT